MSNSTGFTGAGVCWRWAGGCSFSSGLSFIRPTGVDAVGAPGATSPIFCNDFRELRHRHVRCGTKRITGLRPRQAARPELLRAGCQPGVLRRHWQLWPCHQPGVGLRSAIHAIGAVPHAQICQPDIAEMGDPEVQALQGSQNTGQSLSAKAGSGWNGPLRALANRYDRDVCLMGAV